jgi:hypothetical protein
MVSLHVIINIIFSLFLIKHEKLKTMLSASILVQMHSQRRRLTEMNEHLQTTAASPPHPFQGYELR